MEWGRYGAFIAFAIVLVLIPGPDFLVTVKNSLAGGRRRGAWTGVGIATSNAVQGSAAALGLGALVVRSQVVFAAIRWAGVAYLTYLGVQALTRALGRRGLEAPVEMAPRDRHSAWLGWRQGFLSNVTNPKVLVFYIAVLPQFLTADSAPVFVVALALTHALLSLSWLLTVVTLLDRVRAWVTKRHVRRAMDATAGMLLLGFSAKLASEHA
jgi:threonine/homoserine/homoserine lactone efflux protein